MAEWGNLVGAPVENPESQDYTDDVRNRRGARNIARTNRRQVYCTIDNVDPGARFARADGATLEDVERVTLEKAQRHLKQTRRFPPTS